MSVGRLLGRFRALMGLLVQVLGRVRWPKRDPGASPRRWPGVCSGTPAQWEERGASRGLADDGTCGLLCARVASSLAPSNERQNGDAVNRDA